MDAQQKCVTNLASTVVRQDQQIKELKSQIRSLEQLNAQSPGVHSSPKHSRKSSDGDGMSDSNTVDSSCSSDNNSTASLGGCSSKSLQAAVLEAEEEMRKALIDSKKVLERFNSRISSFKAQSMGDGRM